MQACTFLNVKVQAVTMCLKFYGFPQCKEVVDGHVTLDYVTLDCGPLTV